VRRRLEAPAVFDGEGTMSAALECLTHHQFVLGTRIEQPFPLGCVG